MADPTYQAKIHAKNLADYGFATPLERSEVRDRAKQTLRQKHGVENPFALAAVQEQIRQTNLARYGKVNPSQVEAVQRKKERTTMQNHGVKNPQQSAKVKRRTETTCLKRYGSRFPMQNHTIAHRAFLAGVQRKKYLLPSGKAVALAGYEAQVLDELLQNGFRESDFDFGLSKLPAIFYHDPTSGKRRRYFPDFYVPRLNWIIEVKSPYTYRRERCTNLTKIKACRTLGYTANLLIRFPRRKLSLLKE